MKTEIKNSSVKFAEKSRDFSEFLDEMGDQFLDAPHPKSFTVPQGEFKSPALTVKTDRVGVSYPEAAIVMFFIFALGFWVGASHVNGVLKQSYSNLQIEQAAEYLLIGLLPASWIGLTYLYFKTKKGGK